MRLRCSALGLALVVALTATASVGPVRAQELIAFTRTDADGYWQIWLIKPDGGEPRQITHSKVDKREPAWISGGERIVYRTNNGRLFLIDRDGTNEEELLTRYRNIADPQYSPSTAEIIFVRFDPTTMDVSDIWKSDLLGKRPALLTRGGGLKYQPAVSPDGTQVAFIKAAAEDPSSHHLWVMGGDGADPRALTSQPGLYSSPAFSPDGGTLVFSSNFADDNYEVYLLALRGEGIRRLTDHADLDTSPCFSPDGREVAFVSNRSGSQQLWVVGVEGDEPRQLTMGPAESLEPTWAFVAEAGGEERR